MDLGSREIKALSSDTRVMMLKSLGVRRKMPSELAREFSMAPSTIVEHLAVLERSGLIKRIETGHKWKYYELSEKGRSLVRPKFPVQFVVMLSLGVLLTIGGLAGMLLDYQPVLQMSETAGMPVQALCDTAKLAAPQATTIIDKEANRMAYAVLLGMVLILIALGRWLWSKWK